MSRRAAAVAVGLTAALMVTACGAPGAPGPEPEMPASRTLTVLAAASLTDVLPAIAARFEDTHTGVRVRLGLGGSAGLVAQVRAGAPADVLVTANRPTMDAAVGAGLTAADPVVLARNTLVLAVPAGNPAGVTGLVDLADPRLTVALCAPEVPCGGATAALLAASGVTAAPDTLEKDVRAVLTKLRLGEVDAGLVYTTDVLAADGAVEGLDPGPAAPTQVTNEYLAAPLAGSEAPEAAAAFVAFLGTEEAQAVLADAGFGAP